MIGVGSAALTGPTDDAANDNPPGGNSKPAKVGQKYAGVDADAGYAGVVLLAVILRT